MAKGKGKSSGGKETIKPPNKSELRDASKQMRSRHSSGARTMADASVARRQGIKRGGGGRGR